MANIDTLSSGNPARRIGKRVLKAALEERLGKRGNLSTIFEHGHWWVIDRATGRQWDAVDAEGIGSVDGFGFELVSEGKEGQ